MLKLFCYLFYHWNLNLIFFLFWLLPWAMCSAGVSHDKGGSHILWLCTWSNYILRLLIWMAWWNSIWHTTDDEDCILAKYILCTSLTAYLNSFKSFLQCVKKKNRGWHIFVFEHDCYVPITIFSPPHQWQ